MKSVFYFAMVIAIAVVVSCAGGSGNKIVANWKCENVEYPNFDEVIQKALASVPDSLKETQRKIMEDRMRQGAEQMKGNFNLNFKDDKTCELGMGSRMDKGKWSLSEDGKILSLTQDGLPESKSNVEELSDKKLIFSGEQGGVKMKLTFVK